MGEGTSQISSSLAVFGISVDDPCDLSALTDVLTGLTEGFLKEAKESITDLSMKAMGAASFVVLKQLFGEILGAAGGMAAAYAEKVISDVVAKGLGSVYAAIALAVTAVSGFQLIINYLAAVALRTATQKRMAMNSVIDIDIRILISFIQNLQRVLSATMATGLKATGLDAALKALEQAARILGIELSKLQNDGAYGVSKTGVQSAIGHINRSISELMGPFYSATSDALDRVTRETFPSYGDRLDELGKRDSGGGPLNDWEEAANYGKFAHRVKDLMNQEFFADISRKALGTTDFNTAANAKMSVMESYLSKIFPLLPQFGQLLMVQELVGASVNRLIKRMPLGFGLANKFKFSIKGTTYRSGTEIATDFLNPGKDVQEWLPGEPQVLEEPPILTQEPKLTWKRALTAVQIAESALLLAPSYFDFLRETSGIAQMLLRPALLHVREVKSDIAETLVNIQAGQEGATKGLLGKKTSWTTRLLTAKGMLESITPTTGAGTGSLAGIDVATAQEMEQIAEEHLLALKGIIQEQNTNEDGSAKKAPGDEGYSVAQKYLIPLIATQAVLLHKGVAARTLAGLIGVRTLMGKQMGEDQILLNACDQFIASVEALPMFPYLMEQFDKLFGTLGLDSGLGDVIDQLQNGNLSGLAEALDGVMLLNEMANLGLCFGKIGSLNPDFSLTEVA